MIKWEDGCVDCARDGLPCLGARCTQCNISYEVCDRCETEAPCYILDGTVYCEDCAFEECVLADMLDFVNSSDLVGVVFYVNYMFEADTTECDPDLIELCKHDFKEDSEQHLEKLKQFCEDNMDEFLEYCDFSVYTPE